jgi:hypothetical protein
VCFNFGVLPKAGPTHAAHRFLRRVFSLRDLAVVLRLDWLKPVLLENFMPAYSSSTPPLSLFPGDVGFSFNAEAFPANGTAGTQFAIPEPAGLPDQGHTVRWQTIFGTAPSAISIVLQGASADVDAEYFLIDTSTATAGEARTVLGVRARFLRIKVISSTGGASLTAKMLP